MHNTEQTEQVEVDRTEKQSKDITSPNTGKYMDTFRHVRMFHYFNSSFIMRQIF